VNRADTAPVVKDASSVVEADLWHVAHQLSEEFRALAGSSVLLTGGGGFLGHYLVLTVLAWNRLAAEADRIDLTVVDNYMRGVPDWLREVRDDHVRLVAHDITVPLASELGDFDYVMHAASIASPTYYRLHPIATMDANVVGLRLLLERARVQQDGGRPLQGFLFFSSSEIYGDPEPAAIPTPESYPGRVSSVGPRACYDESKRYGETLCVNFASQYGLPVTIARPFNNYGPGLKITDRRVIPDFARDMLAGKDLVILSDGAPTRTFCYIADAVVGYYKVLVKGRPGEPYNVGAERPEVSIGDLAKAMASLGRELFSYTGRVVQGNSPDSQYLIDNPQRRCPDMTKTRRELGFAAEILLEEGLRRTLLWYAGHRNGMEA
jgi:UDP-glucuronate decarboxylase